MVLKYKTKLEILLDSKKSVLVISNFNGSNNIYNKYETPGAFSEKKSPFITILSIVFWWNEFIENELSKIRERAKSNRVFTLENPP
jgi:hypothetical protein